MTLRWITPNWPAPAGVRACSTLRNGGVSMGVYASLNFGTHVGDDPAHVAANRRRLRAALNLPAEPYWLNQVHGTHVVEAGVKDALKEPSPCGESVARGAEPWGEGLLGQQFLNPAEPPSADAAFATQPGPVCVVMTADCLPVLLASRDGQRIAAAHAGWRGLADGVLQATVAAMGGGDLIAWLGPAIGPGAFEVGAEVKQVFAEKRLDNDLQTSNQIFKPNPAGRYYADLYALARIALAQAGVTAIYGGEYCTHTDKHRFFSYRRDRQTGRMATLIWRE